MITSLVIFFLVQLLVATLVVAIPSALVISTVLYFSIDKWVPLSRRAPAFSRAGYLFLIVAIAALGTAFYGFYGLLHSHGPAELRAPARWFVAGSAAAFSGVFLTGEGRLARKKSD
jgi:hypothetical protein